MKNRIDIKSSIISGSIIESNKLTSGMAHGRKGNVKVGFWLGKRVGSWLGTNVNIKIGEKTISLNRGSLIDYINSQKDQGENKLNKTFVSFGGSTDEDIQKAFESIRQKLLSSSDKVSIGLISSEKDAILPDSAEKEPTVPVEVDDLKPIAPKLDIKDKKLTPTEEEIEDFFKAIETGDTSKIKDSLNKYHEINNCKLNGIIPIFYAIKNNQLEIVKLLSEQKTDIERTNRHGYTPLQVASIDDKYEIAKFLLQKGANVSDETIHFAVQGGNIQIIKLILGNKASIDLPGSDGVTPLIRAIFYGNVECVQFLIENGADLNKEDNFQRTPWHEAIRQSRGDIIELLLRTNTQIPCSADSGGIIPSKIIPHLNIHSKKSVPAPLTDPKSEDFLLKLLIENLWSLKPSDTASQSIIGHIEIAKMFEEFLNEKAFSSQKESLKSIINILKNSIVNKFGNQTEVIRQYNDGETLIFTTGPKGHIISVLFVDNYMLVVDRDTRDNVSGTKAQSLKVFKIDRKQNLLDENDIMTLQGNPNFRDKISEKYFYYTLPTKLGYNKDIKDPLKEALEKFSLQTIQKSDNCWIIALKSAIFPLILHKKFQMFSNDQQILLDNFKHSYYQYKDFSKFVRIQSLIDYLKFQLDENSKKPKIDINIIVDCLEKINNVESKYPKNKINELKLLINQLIIKHSNNDISAQKEQNLSEMVQELKNMNL